MNGRELLSSGVGDSADCRRISSNRYSSHWTRVNRPNTSSRMQNSCVVPTVELFAAMFISTVIKRRPKLRRLMIFVNNEDNGLRDNRIQSTCSRQNRTQDGHFIGHKPLLPWRLIMNNPILSRRQRIDQSDYIGVKQLPAVQHLRLSKCLQQLYPLQLRVLVKISSHLYPNRCQSPCSPSPVQFQLRRVMFHRRLRGGRLTSRHRADIIVDVLNAQSVSNKSAAINATILDRQLDVFAVVETWHDAANSPCLIACTPPNYKFIECAQSRTGTASDNVHTNHGGICVFFHSKFRANVISLPQFKSMEVLALFIRSSSLSTALIAVYRPGSATVTSLFFIEFADLFGMLFGVQ